MYCKDLLGLKLKKENVSSFSLCTQISVKKIFTFYKLEETMCFIYKLTLIQAYLKI